MRMLSHSGAKTLLSRVGTALLTCSLVGSLAIPNPALAASAVATAAGSPDGGAPAVTSASQASAAASDAVEFVYIENSLVATGATENVAVGLREGLVPEGTLVSAARLTLADATGKTTLVDATTISGRSLLFACAPAAGTYEVRAIEVTLVAAGAGDATTTSIDLGATDVATRTFSVSDEAIAVAPDDTAVDVRDPSQYAPTTPTGQAAREEAAADGASVAGDASGADGAASLSVTGASADGEVAGSATTLDASDQDAVAAGVEALLASANLGADALDEQADINGDGLFTIALDPGHGGGDSGAVGVDGARECDLNWTIANYCKQELEKYGVPVHLTRGWGDNPSLEQRVANAAAVGADVLVSIHLNATTGGSSGGASGCMVLVPSNQSFNNRVFGEGVALGNSINDQLAALGINNRGLLFRTIDHDPDWDYPTGEEADYYGIIRHARYRNMLGVIVEHCYLDNTGDYYSFLNTDDKLRALGVADAKGIANAYGLTQERAYAAVYNFAQYMAYNSDLPQYYANDPAGAFRHFLEHGMSEGRRASDDFDVRFYKDRYGDLQRAYGNNLPRYFRHYITYGVSEGRQPTAELSAEKSGMRRLYNPYSGEHFYTASAFEKVSLVKAGWNYEGIGWLGPNSSKSPVYRLYNPYAGDHHYTMSAYERDSLKRVGWNDEGVGWYSDDAKATPLYRQYNPYAAAGAHNYTASKVENDHLVSVGWRAEGISWYGLAR